MSNQDIDAICHIAAQRAGVHYHGVSDWHKMGKVCLFQHPITQSSFAIALNLQPTNQIIDKVRVQSFLLMLSWEGIIDGESIAWCVKCGAYYSKVDECPNGCPEQKFCTCDCGDHCDVDSEEGYTDPDGAWWCEMCKKDSDDYNREQKEIFNEAQRETRDQKGE